MYQKDKFNYKKVEDQATYQQFGRTKKVYKTGALPEIPKMIILTKDSHGLKAGTVGLHGGIEISSGYHMIRFIPMNERFKSYLSKNGFESIRDYILFQHEENFCFGAQYWTNPFDYTNIYDDSFEFVDVLNSKIEEKQNQISKIQQEIDALKELSRLIP